MKSTSLKLFLLAIITASISLYSTSLQEMYDNAESGNGYYKYIVLDQNITYTGGLELEALNGDPHQDVAIIGNGAIIDMDSSLILFSNIAGRLDVENCVIVNGQIRYKSHDVYASPDSIQPTGSVKHVTFYHAYSYAIRLQGTGEGILLERNLVSSTVDTGNENQSGNMPTGMSYAFSVTEGSFGTPEILDNWSFKSSWESPMTGDSGDYWKLCETG